MKLKLFTTLFALIFNNVNGILRPPPPLPGAPTAQGPIGQAPISQGSSQGPVIQFPINQGPLNQGPIDQGRRPQIPSPSPSEALPQRPVPSRDLLPPLPPPGTPQQTPSQPQLPQFATQIQSNLIQDQPLRVQPQQDLRPSTITINGEMVELLPPIEIPPEFPIDGDGQDASSFILTTGDGSANQGQFNSFNSNQSPGSGSVAPPSQSGNGGRDRDTGLDCLGSCNCPSDFNFVCGSNRFLYQNECALNCDKKCHPDVIKVNMANCSRK